ncbi:unnamed protein product [Pleuronectes platessa]|uniref:Uncharacterized protein n=1 Tax=Pleuronectes platessa TaxID=8262 RepID=A0A9N7YHC6_PLEPL|nr:unnamed protein product [Pleuronectes platessa]
MAGGGGEERRGEERRGEEKRREEKRRREKEKRREEKRRKEKKGEGEGEGELWLDNSVCLKLCVSARRRDAWGVSGCHTCLPLSSLCHFDALIVVIGAGPIDYVCCSSASYGERAPCQQHSHNVISVGTADLLASNVEENDRRHFRMVLSKVLSCASRLFPGLGRSLVSKEPEVKSDLISNNQVRSNRYRVTRSAGNHVTQQSRTTRPKREQQI